MLFITTYKFSGTQTPEVAGALMKRFGEMGKAPGEIAHYVYADGSGGVVVADTDDPKLIHSTALAYAQWLTFDTRVVLSIDDAVPGILEALQR